MRTTKTDVATMKTRLVTKLVEARINRQNHAEDCLLWDYESNGDCEKCQHFDDVVADLVRKLNKLARTVTP